MEGPEIRERGLVSEIAHPTLGTVPNVGLPVKFSGTPLRDPVAAPLLGADTDSVLRRVLGYDTAKIEAASASGALGDKAKR